jgi:serine/threonine protein kinase
LGPYEILAPIGAGGMGEVYRAWDTRLSREVAVKVLPAAVASDPRHACSLRVSGRPAQAKMGLTLVLINQRSQVRLIRWRREPQHRNRTPAEGRR